jgi:hypothetical protein
MTTYHLTTQKPYGLHQLETQDPWEAHEAYLEALEANADPVLKIKMDLVPHATYKRLAAGSTMPDNALELSHHGAWKPVPKSTKGQPVPEHGFFIALC